LFLTDLEIWKCRFEGISKNEDEGVVTALRLGGEMKKFSKDALSNVKRCWKHYTKIAMYHRSRTQSLSNKKIPVCNRRTTLPKILPSLILLIVSGTLLGCGPRWDFFLAQRAEKKEKFDLAVQQYLNFFNKYPGHKKAPNALFQAGDLYREYYHDWKRARAAYEKIVETQADHSEWKNQVLQALLETPSYFPLIQGARWSEGDSQTGGKLARIEITCQEDKENPDTFLVRHRVFAGKREKKELSSTKIIIKANGILLQKDPSKKYELKILESPLRLDQVWTSQIGKDTAISTVVSKNENVRVRAGTFTNCLKIQSMRTNIPDSLQFDYYAPNVGKILTTTSSSKKKKETRQTELLSYNIPSR